MSKYFVYRVGSHIVINDLKVDEKVFRELHKGFDDENATVITYQTDNGRNILCHHTKLTHSN